MQILGALILGGIVGWLAHVLLKSKAGILANVVVGLVGSALGHWLAGVLGLLAFGMLAHLIVAVLGAMLLIGLLRALKVYR
jgi:uncharacterized membrane protein YeaQ/YmgE (transglycosylase-associated protein family)